MSEHVNQAVAVNPSLETLCSLQLPRQPQGELSLPKPGAYGVNTSRLTMQMVINAKNDILLCKDHLKMLTNTEYSPIVLTY